MDERRTARWRAAWPLLAVLCVWNAHQIARFHEPLKAGHEAWIGRQIGRTARNHLVLGLGVTRGANVTTVRDGGGLELHRSYSPLASWVVALPMAAGLSYHDAIRLPVLLSMNLFLLSLWTLANRRWGARVAGVAVVYAGLCPVVFLRYGLTCIFEILALGPFLAAIALCARPSRSAWTWAGIVAFSTIAAMFSWICWAGIIPCLIREGLRGRVRAAFAVGLFVVMVPLILHFGTTALASGDFRGDVASFVQHVGFRASGGDPRVVRIVTFRELFATQAVRWARNLGGFSIATTLLALAVFVAVKGRVEGWRWVALLLAFALPMNLARNLAYFHDFFIILFVPSVALATGLIVDRWAGRLRDRSSRGFLMGALLVGFLLVDVLPVQKPMRPTLADARQQAVAETLGDVVRADDFVIADGELCGIMPDELTNWGTDRQRSPRPYYAGEMAQTVHVARDADDAARLADSAPPGCRVVVVDLGKSWTFPRPFERRNSAVVNVAVRPTGPDRVATRPKGRD